MLSLCAMAVVSMTQHHQQHLHYLRPVDSRKRISLQNLSNSMSLPGRTFTSTIMGNVTLFNSNQDDLIF